MGVRCSASINPWLRPQTGTQDTKALLRAGTGASPWPARPQASPRSIEANQDRPGQDGARQLIVVLVQPGLRRPGPQVEVCRLVAGQGIDIEDPPVGGSEGSHGVRIE